MLGVSKFGLKFGLVSVGVCFTLAKKLSFTTFLQLKNVVCNWKMPFAIFFQFKQHFKVEEIISPKISKIDYKWQFFF